MGAVFSTLFFIGLSLIQTSNLHLESLPGFLLFSLGSAPAAYICWPRKTRRSAVRMALAGLFTVGLAFLLLGLALGSVAGVGEILEGRPADAPGMFFMIGVITVIFGSIVSLGFPFLIGIGVSLLFREEHGESK